MIVALVPQDVDTISAIWTLIFGYLLGPVAMLTLVATLVVVGRRIDERGSVAGYAALWDGAASSVSWRESDLPDLRDHHAHTSTATADATTTEGTA